jgi:protein TonB
MLDWLSLALLALQAPAGIGPATPKFEPQPAQIRRPLSYIFYGDDYPAAALREGAQGRVSMAIGIDATGRVNACRVLVSSGSRALDGATCRIVRSRARYLPATDARGVQVPDADVGEYVWRLPRPRGS